MVIRTSKSIIRDRYLRKKYGVSLAWYEAQLALQHGQCWICQSTPKKMALAVDHSHTSGKPRGLLCYRCNKFLVGALERCYKTPRTVLVGLNAYFNKYELKGEENMEEQ